MTRILLHHRAHVLVCDGSKALIYANAGDAQAITLDVVGTLADPHPPTRELGTDRPGRTFDSHSGSRSSVQQTDWHDEAEAKFLRHVSEVFDGVVRETAPRQALIIAPPRALGVLRGYLTDAVRRILVAEFARDLVKVPKDKVEAFLQAQGELP